MLTPVQARKQRQQLMRDIAREERRKQREHLRSLIVALREARVARRDALREAKIACRTGRQHARQRVRELRARLLAELRESVKAERARARDECAAGIASARALGTKAERARAELVAEQQFRREMRRIERANRERRRELAPRRVAHERATESDDEVLASIPPELVTLWERVKRQIRGNDRQTRTEAFLHYAEEHPSEVLAAIEDRTEAVVRELEREARSARRALSRAIPRAVLAEAVPF